MDKRKLDGILIRKVLAYYGKNGRHALLWRKNINAYRILVSEIMLQQTQVSRVLPKWKLWMTKYPTLKDLRKAKLKDVLILWQGLGYQQRAKALYEISRAVAKIPNEFGQLRELKGVGTYTASAICAFAYDSFSHPLLETNIRTVLIETYHSHRKMVSDQTLYEDLVRLERNSLVLKAGARKWYYALMDYGVHLKGRNISHNARSSHYGKQSSYKGSNRELRAKILFAIAHGTKLPDDTRKRTVLEKLAKEGYIVRKNGLYMIAEGE